MSFAFFAKSNDASLLNKSFAFDIIESGVGRRKPINKNTNTPIPNHLKSVVLAKPPLLLLFESLTGTLNVPNKNYKINRAD